MWKHVSLATVSFLGAVAVVGCAASSDASADATEAVSADHGVAPIPSKNQPSFTEGLAWFAWFGKNYPEWYVVSPRADADARPWPDGFDPRTDPIFAHNAIEIRGVAPGDVLALLRAGRSDAFTTPAAAYRVLQRAPRSAN